MTKHNGDKDNGDDAGNGDEGSEWHYYFTKPMRSP